MEIKVRNTIKNEALIKLLGNKNIAHALSTNQFWLTTNWVVRPIVTYDFGLKSWVWQWGAKTKCEVRDNLVLIVSGIWAKELIEVSIYDLTGNRFAYFTTGGLAPHYHILSSRESFLVSSRYTGAGSVPAECEFSIIGYALDQEGRHITDVEYLVAQKPSLLRRLLG